MKSKRCSKCGQDLPVREFTKRSNTRDGLQQRCRECQRIIRKKYKEMANRLSREWYKNNRPKAIANAKQWREEHREEYREWQRLYTKRTKAKSRQQSLKKRYNIKPGVFERLLTTQGGRCACCGTNKPGGNGTFCVDHDHVTGSIRGLLCHRCNLGIGLIGDDIMSILGAADYLYAAQKREAEATA